MASSAASRWRVRSRQVIAEVMASMPADATLPQVQKALRDARPHWAMSHHRPYTMWCSEQRKAINQWRKKDEERKPNPHGDKCGVRMSFLKSGHPWIDVICPWCKGQVAGGCMVCVRHFEAMIEALHHPERKALVMAHRTGDPLAGRLLADWYRDHIPGLIEEGQ